MFQQNRQQEWEWGKYTRAKFVSVQNLRFVWCLEEATERKYVCVYGWVSKSSMVLFAKEKTVTSNTTKKHQKSEHKNKYTHIHIYTQEKE